MNFTRVTFLCFWFGIGCAVFNKSVDQDVFYSEGPDWSVLKTYAQESSPLGFLVDCNSNGNICNKISNLFKTGGHRSFSVEFEQPSPDLLEYRFDFYGNGKKDILSAYCGNGVGATCEITFTLSNGKKFSFSLPNGIRFIQIDQEFYFVNGLTITADAEVRVNNYAVHQLFADKISLICNNY